MTDEPDDDPAEAPRIYMRSSTTHGEVEVTVEGSETDDVGECASLAAERFDHAVQEQSNLNDKDDDAKGCH